MSCIETKVILYGIIAFSIGATIGTFIGLKLINFLEKRNMNSISEYICSVYNKKLRSSFKS